MGNKIFTDLEIKTLSKNKYVKNISLKSITYTDEFKRHFINEALAYTVSKSLKIDIVTDTIDNLVKSNSSLVI